MSATQLVVQPKARVLRALGSGCLQWAHGPSRFTGKNFNCVLRLQGLKWVVPASIGLPIDAVFYGLDGFLRPDGWPVVFVCTDDRVYLSEDAGEHGASCEAGLPRSPHCADLRVGRFGDTPGLILGTFGWSLWHADLRRLQVSGQESGRRREVPDRFWHGRCADAAWPRTTSRTNRSR